MREITLRTNFQLDGEYTSPARQVPTVRERALLLCVEINSVDAVNPASSMAGNIEVSPDSTTWRHLAGWTWQGGPNALVDRQGNAAPAIVGVKMNSLADLSGQYLRARLATPTLVRFVRAWIMEPE